MKSNIYKHYLQQQIEYFNSLLSSLDEQELGENLPLLNILPEPWILDTLVLERLNEINQTLRDLKTQPVTYCPFTNPSEDSLMKFLVAPSERDNGLKEIRDFTRDTENLIVIDPYIYGGAAKKALHYVEEFKKAARIPSLKSLHIIFDSGRGNTKATKKEMKRAFKSMSVKPTDKDTNLIHDRIWIKDRRKAIVVGTSLEGLGEDRLSFILPLPDYDLEALLEYLQDNSLL